MRLKAISKGDTQSHDECLSLICFDALSHTMLICITLTSQSQYPVLQCAHKSPLSFMFIN